MTSPDTATFEYLDGVLRPWVVRHEALLAQCGIDKCGKVTQYGIEEPEVLPSMQDYAQIEV